jgi:GDSL-like Lipase/Acylhydrolase family
VTRTALFRRGLLLVIIAALQFALFEIALRTWSHSEAAPAFQALFIPDAAIGYRLRPGARTRFVTSEFETTIAINRQGVRDDRDIGPKPANEKRIVVLGDSLVLSVQVDVRETFCRLLEDRLNAGPAQPFRYRVINAGVQGYGPVEELLFYREVAQSFDPDLVLVAVFVGNDAEEAAASAPRLGAGPRTIDDALSESVSSRLRRIVRHSMVLQVVRVRIVAATERLSTWIAPPEPPLQSYLADPGARVARGLEISRECIRAIASDAAAAGARAVVLLIPARFQVDDADYARLRDIVESGGGRLVRDAATERFRSALAPLGLPCLDVLPALRAAGPGSDLFFQQTVHLTPRGHRIVAAEIEAFLRQQRLVAAVP